MYEILKYVARVQSVNDKGGLIYIFLSVTTMLITLIGWKQSLLLIGMTWWSVPLILLLTDRSCYFLCPWHCRCVRWVQLGTSDHSFVSYLLHFEQAVPECNVRSTVFLKHRPKWNSVHNEVCSITLSAILKFPDPFDTFNCVIGNVISAKQKCLCLALHLA